MADPATTVPQDILCAVKGEIDAVGQISFIASFIQARP